MTEQTTIEAALVAARPRVVAALLRAFRDLDAAEEAFQDACLRALERWAAGDAPDNPVSWLVRVGRNAGIDTKRRTKRISPTAELSSESSQDEGDVEIEVARRIDDARYQDDVLRLLFVCCHPELPPAQQIALALRIVCGLSVKEIARAFLVSESALEQRITRAKARIAESDLPFDAPGPKERTHRLSAVMAMVYLVFNEGYSATGGDSHIRGALCEEAIRLARLLLDLFPEDPSILGLTALLLLQHSRSAARIDAEGEIVLLERQDRSRWDRSMIEEGLALIDRGMRLRRSDAYLVQAAIAALHATAERPEDTDWAQIDKLYEALEVLRPSPVVTLNRAVAVSKTEGPQAALELVEPLEDQLSEYFYFHGVRGGLLLELGRADEARKALERALDLAKSPAEARQIRLRLTETG